MTNITGDERLLKLLPGKNTDCFYKDFSKFQLENDDFVVRDGFESSEYRFNSSEISKYFTLYVILSDNTRLSFDFFNVLKYAKNRGLGQAFPSLFYSYLHQNDTEVITTEENFNKGKKRIFYTQFLPMETTAT